MLVIPIKKLGFMLDSAFMGWYDIAAILIDFIGKERRMKLSTKGRYGISAMFDLALHYGCGPQTVKAIAERQNVPEAYLEQLIAPLRKAGLVQSTRGAQGGYMLTRPPQEVTIGEILRASEGSIAPAQCVLDPCENADGCVMHILWTKLYKGINGVFDGITLGDMLQDAQGCGDCRCGKDK